MALTLTMEEYLKTIAEHTKKKPSFNIVVSGNTSSIVTTFSPSINFGHDCHYEMALINLETYYSFPNIDATNNVLKVSSDGGISWKRIIIPVGCYEIRAISKEVEHQLGKGIVVITPNINTLQCIMTIKDKYVVDFNDANSLRSVLGFNAAKYTSGRHESENLVNILRVNSVMVHNDIIGSSRVNGIEAPVIYNFFPNVAPGEKIISTPRNIIYLPITLHTISRMTCWLTDQNGSKLDLRGEELTIRFHMRAC